MSGYSAPPGGSVAQTVVRRDFEIAFDTPSIATGVALFTPDVGELVIGVKISFQELFDGDDIEVDVTGVYLEIGMLSAELAPWRDRFVDAVNSGHPSVTTIDSRGFTTAVQFIDLLNEVGVSHPVEARVYLRDVVEGTDLGPVVNGTTGAFTLTFITIPTAA